MPKAKTQKPFSYLSIILLITVSFALLVIHTRGFIAHDEGWIVNPAYRFLSGEMPYKDFHFIYFPGSLFLTAWILGIWKSILALRLVAAVFSLVSLILVYKISFSIGKNIFISFLSSAIFFLFLPATINYLAPTPLAVCMGLATVYLLFIKKSLKSRFFWAGIATAFAILFKQNFGMAVVLASILGIFFSMEQKKTGVYKGYFFGIFAGLAPFIVFFLLSGTFGSFIQDIEYFVIEKTLGQSLQVTPFIPQGEGIKQILKTFFYVFPFAVSLPALILAYTKNKKLVPLPLFVMFFYIFGIRPTTDYIHLAPLLSLIGISFAVIYTSVPKESIRTLIYISMVALISVGFFTVGFRHYYRWDSPLKDHNIFLFHPRVQIFGNGVSEKSVRRFNEIVKENRSDNNYVFIYDYMPMYYFITDSKNPTRFDFIPPLTKSEEEEIIDSLKKTNTQIVVSYSALEGDHSLIGEYIKNNFIVKEYPPFFAFIKPSL